MKFKCSRYTAHDKNVTLRSSDCHRSGGEVVQLCCTKHLFSWCQIRNLVHKHPPCEAAISGADHEPMSWLGAWQARRRSKLPPHVHRHPKLWGSCASTDALATTCMRQRLSAIWITLTDTHSCSRRPRHKPNWSHRYARQTSGSQASSQTGLWVWSHWVCSCGGPRRPPPGLARTRTRPLLGALWCHPSSTWSPRCTAPCGPGRSLCWPVWSPGSTKQMNGWVEAGNRGSQGWNGEGRRRAHEQHFKKKKKKEK